VLRPVLRPTQSNKWVPGTLYPAVTLPEREAIRLHDVVFN
jgi:hypothetical protein